MRAVVKPPFSTMVVGGAGYCSSALVFIVLGVRRTVLELPPHPVFETLLVGGLSCVGAMLVLNLLRPIRLSWLVPRFVGQVLVTLCSPPLLLFSAMLCAPHGMGALARVGPMLLALALGTLAGGLILRRGPWRQFD